MEWLSLNGIMAFYTLYPSKRWFKDYLIIAKGKEDN